MYNIPQGDIVIDIIKKFKPVPQYSLASDKVCREYHSFYNSVPSDIYLTALNYEINDKCSVF